jgi:hypothetical protein
VQSTKWITLAFCTCCHSDSEVEDPPLFGVFFFGEGGVCSLKPARSAGSAVGSAVGLAGHLLY